MLTAKEDIRTQLQADILRMQGYKSTSSTAANLGLGLITRAFPNATFPTGAVHEFLPAGAADQAATDGFIAGLLSTLLGSTGTSLWISAARQLFPPALKSFGLQPDRIIFIDPKKEKDVHWIMEEALKCEALTTVVAELTTLDFKTSRRLQLAVEHSGVTGFIMRHHQSRLTPNACVARWKIRALASDPMEDLPGIAHPKWQVELLRVKNGNPGSWEVNWVNGKLQPVVKRPPMILERKAKTG